jgi:hypothetical protein
MVKTKRYSIGSSFFMLAFLFTSFATARKPIILTGSRENGEVGLRQQSDIENPVPWPHFANNRAGRLLVITRSRSPRAVG